jgi:outer membrane protein, heavy metal efflux system
MKAMIVFFAVSFSVVSFSSQENPLALDELVQTALERNPKIAAAAREAEANSYRILPARTLPDPMIEFSLKNMGLSEFTVGMDPESGVGFSLSQTFPFPGKLRLKGDIARKSYERKLTLLDLARLEVIRDLKTAYLELFYSRKSAEILEQQKRLISQALKLAESQYAVGTGTQSDIFKAQIEISRMDEMIIPMREMTKAVEARINLLLDYAPDRPLGMPAVSETASLTVSIVELERRAVAASPMARDALLMVEENEKMVAMAKREFYPDFRISAGWEYRGKLTDMYEVMAGLEIPLYARRRQANVLREARALESGSLLNSRAVRNDLLAMVSENFVKAKTAENLIRLYRNQLRIQSRLAVESSLANYQVGKVDFMAVLNDINNQFSFELAYYRELSQFWTAAAVLESIGAGPVANP